MLVGGGRAEEYVVVPEGGRHVEGAPFRLGDYMSGQRFKRISVAMRYTDVDVLPFLDRFHDIRQMMNSFNEHYKLTEIQGDPYIKGIALPRIPISRTPGRDSQLANPMYLGPALWTGYHYGSMYVPQYPYTGLHR